MVSGFSPENVKKTARRGDGQFVLIKSCQDYNVNNCLHETKTDFEHLRPRDNPNALHTVPPTEACLREKRFRGAD